MKPITQLKIEYVRLIRTDTEGYVGKGGGFITPDGDQFAIIAADDAALSRVATFIHGGRTDWDKSKFAQITVVNTPNVTFADIPVDDEEL